MNNPRYLELLNNGILAHRVDILKSMLEDCVLCPHQCKVNRLKGERGYCKTLEHAIVSGAEPHFGEEDELVGSHGSGTIFFSQCNLRCVFCQNYQISHLGVGQEIDTFEIAELMLELQQRGCNNINFVSPGHVIPQIVQSIYIAAQQGLNIPIVYNTNGYDLTDSLRLLEGIVDIYMPDIKFSNDDLAMKYLGVKNYYTVAKNAIKEMYRQVGSLKLDNNGNAYSGLMIRHLVMPENLAGTDKIMDFIANEISKETYVNIMAQYSPEYRAFDFDELSKSITEQEYEKAFQAAKDIGLTNVKGCYSYY